MGLGGVEARCCMMPSSSANSGQNVTFMLRTLATTPCNVVRNAIYSGLACIAGVLQSLAMCGVQYLISYFASPACLQYLTGSAAIGGIMKNSSIVPKRYFE